MSSPVSGVVSRAPGRGLVRRSVGLGIALLLAAGVAVPTPGLANDDQAQLDQTRAQLAAIEKRLAASKGQAATIQSQVNALDRQISVLDRQVGVDTRSVADLESTIRTDDARIGQLQAAYDGAHAAANARARSIYMGGPASSLSSLLSASSITDFMRKTVVWQIAAGLDASVIIHSARLRDALAVQKQDLDQATAALTAKEGSLRSRADLLNNARAERSSALAAVQAQIDAEQQAEDELQAQSEALTAALENDAALSHGPGDVSAAGLSWPLHGPVGSPFGPRGRGFHYGIDILAGTGTPIHSAKDGTIAGVACGSGYGICTIIDHGGGVATLYAHMSRKAMDGGHVSAGEVIGYVGCTGFCTGPHLHFEVRINGVPKNPRSYLP